MTHIANVPNVVFKNILFVMNKRYLKIIVSWARGANYLKEWTKELVEMKREFGPNFLIPNQKDDLQFSLFSAVTVFISFDFLSS